MKAIEILGPPMSSFEVCMDSYVIKIMYETIAICSTNELKLHTELETQLQLIRNWCAEEEDRPRTRPMRILWWRLLPDFSSFEAQKATQHSRARPAGFGVWCRLATTPSLPPEIRSQINFKPEGSESVWLK